MKVKNMTNDQGNAIANQFIITDNNTTPQIRTFQSYDSVIVVEEIFDYDTKKVFIDENKWDYSNTTGKYRNHFLGESKEETQKKIDSGEYILTDLN